MSPQELKLSMPALTALFGAGNGGFPAPDQPEPDPNGPLGPISRLMRRSPLFLSSGWTFSSAHLARTLALALIAEVQQAQQLADLLPAEAAEKLHARLAQRVSEITDDCGTGPLTIKIPLDPWWWLFPPRPHPPRPNELHITAPDLVILGVTLYQARDLHPVLGDAGTEIAELGLQRTTG